MSQGKSVGAIIKNEKGEYLVQYRLREPVGLAMPAGHIDDGESPEEALGRELLEETGIGMESAKLVFHGYIENNPCGSGHTGHDWWAYEVVAKGVPELKEPAEHKFVRFMPLAEMRPYIENRDYDSAWFEHILPSLGII
jgi:8-oxo-dGTP pyrophosphatase MutT (NUDIX family)